MGLSKHYDAILSRNQNPKLKPLSSSSVQGAVVGSSSTCSNTSCRCSSGSNSSVAAAVAVNFVISGRSSNGHNNSML